MSAVAKLNELLFENSEKIPEGLYLELMNLTKEVFNEKPEPITIKTTTIKYTDPIIHLLGRIQVNPRDLYETPSIALYNARGFRVINQVEVGELIELTSYGEDKIFYEVRKINKCSVKILERIFIWDIGINKYKAYHYNHKIKIATKNELNDIGVSWLNIEGKDIRFYGNFSKDKIYGDYMTCLDNLQPTN